MYVGSFEAFPHLRIWHTVLHLLQVLSNTFGEMVGWQFGAEFGQGLSLTHHIEGVVDGPILVADFDQPGRMIFEHLRNIIPLELVLMSPFAKCRQLKQINRK